MYLIVSSIQRFCHRKERVVNVTCARIADRLHKVNFLGGKRVSGERPNDTAYREFLEETGGLLNGQNGPLMIRIISVFG